MAERVRAVPQDFVEMVHPNVDGVHRCSPRAVRHWEKRGWVVKDLDAGKTPLKPAAAKKEG